MFTALQKRARAFGISAGAAAILLSACGGQAANRAGAPSSPAAPVPTSPAASPSAPAPSLSPALKIGTRNIAGVGLVLDNGKGFTLYHLTTDSSSMTTCTGGCSQTWPPLLAANGKAPVEHGLMGTFGTLTRPDGSIQVTFNGMPLYMFAGDAQPGQANGQGIGGVWFAVKG
jgi:predicted lipoprotein with Yx(FWY)xxD motif